MSKNEMIQKWIDEKYEFAEELARKINVAQEARDVLKVAQSLQYVALEIAELEAKLNKKD